jgi:DNA-binding GntR family transcriptional regulator
MEKASDAQSSVMDVVDGIVFAVREGQLAPGQRLVENDFARRFGVSRTTVREAFQRLEAQGLLTQERHKGFTVCALTRRRLIEVFQIREVLDGLAARLAAPHFKADSRALKALMSALEKARRQRDLAEFSRLNREFHDLIRQVSGQALAANFARSVEQSVYHHQFRLLAQRPRVFAGQDEHERIFRALIAGDSETAENEARSHVRASLAALLTLPDHYFSPEDSKG